MERGPDVANVIGARGVVLRRGGPSGGAQRKKQVVCGTKKGKYYAVDLRVHIELVFDKIVTLLFITHIYIFTIVIPSKQVSNCVIII